jgi:DNA polymerase III subunit delta
MYKKELENALNQKSFNPYFFFYGECDFQNNYFAQKVLEKWQIQANEKLLMYYDEYDFSTAKNFLAQSSLFGGNNVLIVKTDKALVTKELEALIALTKKSHESFFIYQYFGEGTKAKRIAKPFEKNFVRFFKLGMSEALNLLNQEARAIELKIQGYALSHLYQLHLENISLCINEFEKLKLLNKEITPQDIDKVVYGLGSIGLENFIEKLILKQDITSAFQNLCENGFGDEIRIVNAAQNYLSNLILFHLYIKINGRFDAREILGYPLPMQIAQKRAAQSIKIDLQTYKELYELLLKAELKLKKLKDIDKNSFLLSTLISFQKLL